MKHLSLLICLLCLSPLAQAGLIGTGWTTQSSKLFSNTSLVCSSNPADHTPSQPINYGQPYLRFEKWNSGWFHVALHGGCSLGTLQNHSYMFRRVGSDVFDQNGTKVGTISDVSIQLANVTDVSQRIKIQTFSFLIQGDGTALSDIVFQDPSSHGVSEFQGLFTLSFPKKN
jgi:hypothetical protein